MEASSVLLIGLGAVFLAAFGMFGLGAALAYGHGIWVALGAAVLAAFSIWGTWTIFRQHRLLQEKLETRSATLDQFRLLIDGITDFAIYMLDAEGRIATWNSGAERINGYRAEEVLGRNYAMFFTAEDRAAGRPAQELEAAARDGHYESESLRVRKDGTQFLINSVIDAVYSEGKLIGFAKITRDLTTRISQQAELDSARAALAQAQKMDALGQLTGGVAHDFNNILHVIKVGVEMLQRRLKLATEGDEGRIIDTVRRSVDRAASLVQGLLAFARRQPLDPRPVDANRLITGIAELLHRSLGENIAIDTVLGAGLWRALADSNQLETAILNLAVNARDAMPDGGRLTIETSNAFLGEAYCMQHEEVSVGQYVVIAVSDTGTGMAPEVVAKAFEPFYTTKDVGAGTGLGLSQVYGFAKQSGGHVTIYSEVGTGTTVKLYLPRLMTAEPAESDGRIVGPVQTGGDETVLLVEDDGDVRAFTAEALGELGYRVLTARDADAAFRILERYEKVDLLFTDVGLPGINGKLLADEVRRLRPAIKVLFTTGYARNAILHHGRLDAGVDLIVKPFTQRELSEKIRRILDRT